MRNGTGESRRAQILAREVAHDHLAEVNASEALGAVPFRHRADQVFAVDKPHTTRPKLVEPMFGLRDTAGKV